MTESVERWDVFELALDGPKEGNPFLDVEFGAAFRYKNRHGSLSRRSTFTIE